MKTLFACRHLLETRENPRLSKQEYMRATLRIACSKTQQTAQRSITEVLRIIDQDIDFLPGKRQLANLSQNRRQVATLHLQALGEQTQHTGRIGRALGGHHNT